MIELNKIEWITVRRLEMWRKKRCSRGTNELGRFSSDDSVGKSYLHGEDSR